MHNIIMSRAHQEEMNTNQNLYQGYVELYHNGLFHIKSTALRCAVELGIPDAIHRRGGAATVSDLAVDTSVHPGKLPCLRRLMRMLTVSGIFAVDLQPAPPSDDETRPSTSSLRSPASLSTTTGLLRLRVPCPRCCAS